LNEAPPDERQRRKADEEAEAIARREMPQAASPINHEGAGRSEMPAGPIVTRGQPGARCQQGRSSRGGNQERGEMPFDF